MRRTRLTFQRDSDEQDADDREFHEQRHQAYRAAVDYVDGSLRDDGRDPAAVRAECPGGYATAVKRTYVRICATLHSDPGISAPVDSPK